jgi:hypothetical protein
MLALGLAIGLLPLIFLFAYFLIFNDLKTPPNSTDGQAGLPEFLRLIYSLGAAATCAVLGFFIALRRFWPRTKI